jgi:hypothetical protein
LDARPRGTRVAMGEPDRNLPPDDPEFGYRAALSRRRGAWLAPVWILVGAAVAVFAIWALVH